MADFPLGKGPLLGELVPVPFSAIGSGSLALGFTSSGILEPANKKSLFYLVYTQKTGSKLN